MAIIIQPWRIPEEGAELEGEEPGDILSLEPDSLIQPEGPVRYILLAQYVTHELIVTGEVCARIRFACSRCADPVLLEVRDSKFLVAREVENLHDTVDLTDEVRESIILAFPSYPLCQSDCRGLCVQCGVNRNREHCDCKPLARENWTVLSGLDKIEVKNGRTQKEEI